jgi:large subunit ribosomal protein L33
VSRRVERQVACQPKWLAILQPKGWHTKGTNKMREIVTLQCGECKERNYSTTKNKKTTTGRLEFSKFCNRCRKHTAHKETK